MVEYRAEHRATVDLPVRVWGMSVDGHPFSQPARVQNINSVGALISGIESDLKVGDTIGVQCEEKKARCTVIWVMSADFLKKHLVGVKVLAGQECPWKSHFQPGAAPAVPPALQRRRWLRHKISVPVEIRDERVNSPSRVSATDVSGNGCYVENMLPFPLDTLLRVGFWVESEHFDITAVVRTCDPGVGNGIEFTGLAEEGKRRFQAYLDKVDPPKRMPPTS
jgi:hypothetical protein